MLTIDKLSQNLLNAEYAVRGRVTTRAQELEKQGKEIIYCNIGNPHTFDQKPLTYIREILSLLEYPDLLNKQISKFYAQDSIKRAKFILSQIPEGLGAYSTSAGIDFVRQAVADFISRRDSIATDPDRIILTDGAGMAARSVIMALIRNPQDGIMLPIPQYPMYSATLSLVNGQTVGYYLDEENHWQLNEEILLDSYNRAITSGVNPVAITVINPGNPTGAVLSYDNIKMIINFARKHNLSILADEVYQENIYSKTGHFHSFAKIMTEMKIDDVSLFSFHSVSKGFTGECGHRGGYMEVRNVSDAVFAQLIKLQSINLCANVAGQMVTYLMVSPPKPGEESYEKFLIEKTAIQNELRTKAQIIGMELNKIDGISVNNPEGAMYAYVKFELPENHPFLLNPAIATDEQYCLNLLEETGICVVPGSGFGQLPGTLHFRTTFLPSKQQIIDLVARLDKFQSTTITKNLSS